MGKRHGNRVCGVVLAGMVAAAIVMSAPVAAGDGPRIYNIPAGDIGAALREFARQSNRQILFSSDVVSKKTTEGANRELSLDGALTQLLAGSGLVYSISADGVILVMPADAKGSSATSGPPVAPHSAPVNQSRGSPLSQTQQSGGLEEIIVTAQRRSQRLEDVPISVSAFSQKKLEIQSVRSIDDLALLSPGISFERLGLTSASNYNDENSDIAIRGIDSNAGSATTAIYVDDTPIQGRHMGFGTVSAYPVLFDLDRVEELRGPQGTLFGASAEGGAIRFVTPEPGLTAYSGYLRSELATSDQGGQSYETGAAGAGALLDGQLGFRASAYFREDGGYVDRADYRTDAITAPDANWQRVSTLRLALKWAVNDFLSITPSIYYQRLYLNDTSAYWPLLSDPAAPHFVNGNAQRSPSADRFYLAAAKLQWDLGTMRLTANASYFSRHQHDEPDYSQYDRAAFGLSPFPQYRHTAESHFQDKQNNSMVEVKLQSNNADTLLTWTAGVYAAHLAENATQFLYDPTFNDEIVAAGGILCTRVAPCPNGQIYSQPQYQIIDKQAAVFGEANVKLGVGFSVTGGVRVERAEFIGNSVIYGPFLGPLIGPQTPVLSSGSSSSTPVTPRAVLAYKSTRDVLMYASVAKGYREGGLNQGLGVNCLAQLQAIGINQSPAGFGQDSLWSYELGGKFTLLDRRLQINASLFYIDWKNVQQNVYLPTCGQQFVANLGAASSRGGDIDVEFRPIESFLFSLQAAYTDAKYTETVCGGALGCVAGLAAPIVSKGDKLPGAPETYTLSGEYDAPKWAEREPYVHFDLHFSARQSGLLAGQNPANGTADPSVPNVPGFTTLGVRAGMRWAGIDLSLFGQNLTNAHPVLVYSRDTIVSPLYFGRSLRPMTIGATASYRY